MTICVGDLIRLSPYAALSRSAIFVDDIWRPYVKPGAGDKHYLWVARITSLCATGFGLSLVPVFMKDTIYEAHGTFTAAATPPVVIAVFLGITWKHYTPAAAFVTIVGGHPDRPVLFCE